MNTIPSYEQIIKSQIKEIEDVTQELSFKNQKNMGELFKSDDEINSLVEERNDLLTVLINKRKNINDLVNNIECSREYVNGIIKTEDLLRANQPVDFDVNFSNLLIKYQRCIESIKEINAKNSLGFDKRIEFNFIPDDFVNYFIRDSEDNK